jgi:hypothetical protein
MNTRSWFAAAFALSCILCACTAAKDDSIATGGDSDQGLAATAEKPYDAISRNDDGSISIVNPRYILAGTRYPISAGWYGDASGGWHRRSDFLRACRQYESWAKQELNSAQDIVFTSLAGDGVLLHAITGSDSGMDGVYLAPCDATNKNCPDPSIETMSGGSSVADHVVDTLVCRAGDPDPTPSFRALIKANADNTLMISVPTFRANNQDLPIYGSWLMSSLISAEDAKSNLDGICARFLGSDKSKGHLGQAIGFAGTTGNLAVRLDEKGNFVSFQRLYDSEYQIIRDLVCATGEPIPVPPSGQTAEQRCTIELNGATVKRCDSITGNTGEVLSDSVNRPVLWLGGLKDPLPLAGWGTGQDAKPGDAEHSDYHGVCKLFGYGKHLVAGGDQKTYVPGDGAYMAVIDANGRFVRYERSWSKYEPAIGSVACVD